MTFSIIIPLYNKAPYVAKALKSVLGQTFSDYELIVIDNASSDGSDEIVHETIKHSDHQEIKIIKLEENTGPGGARNRGITESSAPYVCFLDADDWWEPTFLEEMANLIKCHPGAGIYGTGYWIVKDGKKRLAPIGIDKNFTECEINYCQIYSKTLCMPLTSITVAIPRIVFKECGVFKPHLKLGEDFDLWIRIALNHKVVFLNKPLSNYNQDVDVIYRGTHHLHNPKEHMLWNLDYLEPVEKTNPNYKQLIDNLRTYDLVPYLLDHRYRDAARHELAKVDWNLQDSKTKKLYQLPIWLLKTRHYFLSSASKIKQLILQ